MHLNDVFDSIKAAYIYNQNVHILLPT